MICPVCTTPVESGELCAGCAAKTTVVRPASRFLVDRAARKSLRLASRVDVEGGEALVDFTIDSQTAGRRW